MRRRDGYRDRTHAGQVLADAVLRSVGEDGACVVLALPRGGVPVAGPIATRLAAPLGLVLVRKLGAPGRPELAMGALARVGSRTEVVRNEEVISAAGVDEATFEGVCRAETERLLARAAGYGENRVEATGRTVVLVDDGLATGTTALAAVTAARSLDPAAVILAVPVGSAPAVRTLSDVADRVICPLVPRWFEAVSLYFDDFDQLTDAEVLATLAAFRG